MKISYLLLSVLLHVTLTFCATLQEQNAEEKLLSLISRSDKRLQSNLTYDRNDSEQNARDVKLYYNRRHIFFHQKNSFEINVFNKTVDVKQGKRGGKRGMKSDLPFDIIKIDYEVSTALIRYQQRNFSSNKNDVSLFTMLNGVRSVLSKYVILECDEQVLELKESTYANELKKYSNKIISKQAASYIDKILTKYVYIKVGNFMKEIYVNIRLNNFTNITPENIAMLKNVIQTNNIQPADVVFDENNLETYVKNVVSYTNYYVSGSRTDNTRSRTLTTSTVSSKNEQSYVSDLTLQISELRNDLIKLETWSLFLNDLKQTFESYEVQVNKTTLSPIFVNLITNANIIDYLQKVTDEFKLQNPKLGKSLLQQNFTITDNMLNELNSIIKFFLRDRPKIVSGNSGELNIIGNYLVLSNDFKDSQCNNVKNITFMAMKKIFIDVPIFCSGVNIIMISPYIDVRKNNSKNSSQNPEINISGKRGGDIQAKAKDGQMGIAGDPGKLGLLGTNSGNLIIVALEIFNSEKLLVSANGGNGGAGQDGGSGFNGINSSYPSQSIHFREKNDNFQTKMEEDDYKVAWHSETKDRHKTITFYRVTSKNGTPPSASGGGGVGGYGGFAGDVNIISSMKSNVKIKQSDGSTGKDGKDGRRGIVSYTTVEVGYKCERSNRIMKKKFFHNCDPTGKVDFYSKKYPEEPKRSSETRKMRSPKIPLTTLVTELIRYKKIFRSGLQSNVNRTEVKLFLTFLQSKNSILEQYTLMNFLEDFMELENEYREMNVTDSLFHYSQLVFALDISVKNHYVNQSDKIVQLLQSAFLARVNQFKNSLDRSLIIDLKEYLSNTVANIKKLEDRGREIVIFDHQNKFKSDIQQLVDQVNDFSDNEIIKLAESTKKKMDEAIKDLVIEIENLKKEEEQYHDALKQMEKDLKKNMRRRFVFGIVHLVTSVISTVYPAVGGVLGKASSVMENLSVKNVDTSGITNVASDAINGIKSFLYFNDEPINEAYYLLGNISNDSKDLQGHGINEQVYSATEKLKKINSSIDFNKLECVKDQVTEVVSEVEKYLTTIKSKDLSIKGRTNIDKLLDITDKTKIVLSFPNEAIGSFRNFRTDKVKLNVVHNAMYQSEQNMNLLKEFEAKIYTHFSPMLYKMLQDLTSMVESIKEKNIVSIEIDKWNFRNYITNTRDFIAEMANGLKIENDLLEIIDKFADLFNLLSNLYEKVQYFYDQQKLSKYIADVNTAGTECKSTEPEICVFYNKLLYSTQSYILLSQYNKAKSAYSQMFFPFAGSFIKQLNIGDWNVTTDEKLRELTFMASKNVYEMTSKLSNSVSTLNNDYDADIISSEFNSNSESTQPFYVWSNQTQYKSIEKLLNGSQITLRSDILMQGGELNAVKFNLVELNITAIDKKMQPELNELLKKFHVTLTHFGTSYYKCGYSYYEVQSEIAKILHSFERDRRNVPIHRNDVYNKMKSGDIFLSPYTTWAIKIEYIRGEADFEILKKFIGNVQLELIGSGQYVKRGAKICSGEFDI